MDNPIQVKAARLARHHQLQAELFHRREEYRAVVELLQIRLEETKEGLVVCPVSELASLQGVARALDKMLAAFFIPRADIQPKSETPAPAGIVLY